MYNPSNGPVRIPIGLKHNDFDESVAYLRLKMYLLLPCCIIFLLADV